MKLISSIQKYLRFNNIEVIYIYIRLKTNHYYFYDRVKSRIKTKNSIRIISEVQSHIEQTNNILNSTFTVKYNNTLNNYSNDTFKYLNKCIDQSCFPDDIEILTKQFIYDDFILNILKQLEYYGHSIILDFNKYINTNSIDELIKISNNHLINLDKIE